MIDLAYCMLILMPCEVFLYERCCFDGIVAPSHVVLAAFFMHCHGRAYARCTRQERQDMSRNECSSSLLHRSRFRLHTILLRCVFWVLPLHQA